VPFPNIPSSFVANYKPEHKNGVNNITQKDKQQNKKATPIVSTMGITPTTTTKW
jgi:hypothetical protein